MDINIVAGFWCAGKVKKNVALVCLVGGKERGRKENCGIQCMNLD
jgi:hypothetical protein